MQTKISSEAAGFGNRQPRLVTQASLSVTKPPGFAPIGHLHYDIILLLRPESFRVLLSCVNEGFCYLNLTGITNLNMKGKMKRILVVVVK